MNFDIFGEQIVNSEHIFEFIQSHWQHQDSFHNKYINNSEQIVNSEHIYKSVQSHWLYQNSFHINTNYGEHTANDVSYV